MGWKREGGPASLDAQPSSRRVQMAHNHRLWAPVSCLGRLLYTAKISIPSCSQGKVEGEAPVPGFLALDKL